MFNHKKIFTALLFAPLFTACVVNGDDSDDSNDTGTDPTNASNTVSATAPGTDDSGSTSLTTTTTPGTEDDSGSGDTAVDSGDSTAGETDTGGDGMACFPTCTEAVDCCAGDPTCEAGIGSYPYTYECTDGFCFPGAGCSSDEECTFGGALPGWTCNNVDGYGLCALGCTEDADCESPATPGYLCTGGGNTYCEPAPCETDKDCLGEGYTCEADGTCSAPPCTSDRDCAGFGVCNLDNGACECGTSDECPEGYGCDAP